MMAALIEGVQVVAESRAALPSVRAALLQLLEAFQGRQRPRSEWASNSAPRPLR